MWGLPFFRSDNIFALTVARFGSAQSSFRFRAVNALCLVVYQGCKNQVTENLRRKRMKFLTTLLLAVVLTCAAAVPALADDPPCLLGDVHTPTCTSAPVTSDDSSAP